MGAAQVTPENGRVVFEGSPEMIARANIRARFVGEMCRAEPFSVLLPAKRQHKR